MPRIVLDISALRMVGVRYSQGPLFPDSTPFWSKPNSQGSLPPGLRTSVILALILTMGMKSRHLTDLHETWQKHVNRCPHFVAKFWIYSVKESLFRKTAHFVDFRRPPCHGVTAHGRRFWAFGYILSSKGHAKDVPFFGELCSVSYHFRVINPLKSRRWTV